ncbi:MAG: hypothetical protein IJS97_04370 [Prevotella sp.]|nr:hypothetical protein [Prevotella sp.]
MKNLFVILFLLMSVSVLHAQKFIVYAVTGNITQTEGKTQKTIAVRQRLTPNDNLSIPEKGIIRLFDHANKKLYTLKGKCTGTIETMIKNQSGSEKTVTPQYFAYIVKNLKGNLVTNTVETDNATTIFRDQVDSLFISQPATPTDTIRRCQADSICNKNISKE